MMLIKTVKDTNENLIARRCDELFETEAASVYEFAGLHLLALQLH